MHRLEDIADVIAGHPRQERTLVAVDGGDASGKTTYAAALADALTARGRTVEVIHVDDFLHVPAVRHRRGRTSPEGYLHDSYDYEALAREVHKPLEHAAAGAITIVEGLFLLRDELASWWDCSVFLDVPLHVTMARKSRRDGVALPPGAPLTRRYVEGQRLYREQYEPHRRATWVVPDVDDGRPS